MINWKLRLKNKATLVAILLACITLIYQILDMLGIAPAIEQTALTNVVGLVVNLLVMLGVVVDPTTAGVTDSEQAMSYDEPSNG